MQQTLNRDSIFNSKFNPYATTFGRTFKYKQFTDELIKFGTTRPFQQSPYSYSLSYDLTMGSFVPVVITGKFEEERNIPPFQLPILYFNHKDEPCVAIDLREYVGNIDTSATTYDDLVKSMSRPGNAMFLFRLARVMCELAEGGYSSLPFKDGLKAYVFVYTTIIKNIINLDVEEEDVVRVCLGSFYCNLTNKENIYPTELDRYADIIKNNCFILKLKFEEVKNIVLALITENTAVSDEKLVLMPSLLDYISCYMSEDKKKKLKDAIIVNILTNLWFGPGKNFAGISSIECLPLFLTMTESSYGDRNFKISRLAGILSKDTKSVDKKNYLSTMESNFKFH